MFFGICFVCIADLSASDICSITAQRDIKVVSGFGIALIFPVFIDFDRSGIEFISDLKGFVKRMCAVPVKLVSGILIRIIYFYRFNGLLVLLYG